MEKYTSITDYVYETTPIYRIPCTMERKMSTQRKVHNSALKGIRHKVNKSHKNSISQDAKNKSENIATGK